MRDAEEALDERVRDAEEAINLAVQAGIGAIDARTQSVEVIDGGFSGGVDEILPECYEGDIPHYAALYNSEDCSGGYFKIEFEHSPYTDVS